MFGMDNLEALYVTTAFLFQFVLIVHFSLRKWAYDTYTLPFGWIVYALSVPAAFVSLVIAMSGEAWSLWLGGFLYLCYALYGYIIEYKRKLAWRNPIRWPIFGPYITLYLATVMFYWWPLGLISRPLWYVYLVLFLISTTLNITSHRSPQDKPQSA